MPSKSSPESASVPGSIRLLQGAQGVGLLQGPDALVDQGHGSPGADPLALPSGGVDQLPAAGEDLLRPGHVAGHRHRLLAGVGVGHGGGVGVGKIGGQVDAEVDQDGEKDGGQHQFCGKGAVFHDVVSPWRPAGRTDAGKPARGSPPTPSDPRSWRG